MIVTEWFLHTYQDSYEHGDYDTIWQALKQYRREGQTIPLNPEENSY